MQRSHRRPWERPLSWLGVLPYRCQECLARFYRIRRLQPRRALTEASE